MKSKILKSLCGLLTVTSMVSIVACNPGVQQTGDDVDYAKTQLYVYNNNGGFGNKWIQNVKTRFESQYANWEGAGGKKGVQIIVEDGKRGGTDFLEIMSADRNEIIFTESVQYYEFVSRNLLYDISDFIEEPLSQFGEI